MSDKDAYQYKRFTTRMLLHDMRFSGSAPSAGDEFPEFDLPSTDGHRVTKSDFVGERPMLMILGSLTCPMTSVDRRRKWDTFGPEIKRDYL